MKGLPKVVWESQFGHQHQGKPYQYPGGARGERRIQEVPGGVHRSALRTVVAIWKPFVTRAVSAMFVREITR